ncbi:MAG: aminotransferase class I/II-fold pyridoxal phosphate-dependent enzyme [Candidatus Aminicenantes bacterium]|nr:aminotransferase class I/II-fold pyridoxal phosphate-dependent enzyme [Candidatus Aminicenantes bacterium]
MKIELFQLERIESLWENTVEYNLSETGIHPFSLEELLDEAEMSKLHSIRLGYGQTNGSIELREAISSMYPGTDQDNILVTSGAIEANFITIWNLLDKGDEIVLMLPNYMQIWGVTRAFGIDVKPFYLKEELDWQPALNELRDLITSKTKMIAVCNPNNPTGAILSEDAMAEIVKLAREADAWLYADEIYRGAELNGVDTPSFYGRTEKAIVTGGLSKAYALPGLRIGWIVAPHNTIADLWARRDYTTIATGILSNRIATLALQPEMRTKIVKRNRNMLNENLDVLTKWANQHENLFKFIPPQAGGMAFLRYNMKINSTELSTKIREEKSTFIVPGDCFGMDHRIRIGIGSERNYLSNALERISETLTEIV